MKKYQYILILEEGSTMHLSAHCWQDAARMAENGAKAQSKAIVGMVRVDVEAAYKPREPGQLE